MGAGWPVWCGVGVGRGDRGVGWLADGEADGRRAGREVAGEGRRGRPVGIRDGAGTAGGRPEDDAAGEAAGPARVVERAAGLGAGALVASALWPPSTTASAIATPTAASAPASTAAPERKLISSMRA